jgi:tripartite-type tricarboxylate transporter receptor subunit TctC
MDVPAFSGVAAPAGTPRAVIDLLNRTFNAILQEPETRATFNAQGCDVAGGSPEDFRRVIADDYATWSRVVRAGNIKVE